MHREQMTLARSCCSHPTYPLKEEVSLNFMFCKAYISLLISRLLVWSWARCWKFGWVRQGEPRDVRLNTAAFLSWLVHRALLSSCLVLLMLNLPCSDSMKTHASLFNFHFLILFINTFMHTQTHTHSVCFLLLCRYHSVCHYFLCFNTVGWVLHFSDLGCLSSFLYFCVAQKRLWIILGTLVHSGCSVNISRVYFL